MFAHGAVIRRSFNRKLAMTVCLIALSQFNFGFDQGGFSSTQAMDSFAKKFGDYDPKSKTYIIDPVFLSLFNSLNYITFGLGIIIGSFISSRFGRRMCMFTMSIWALLAAAIVITSQTKAQILVGRMLAYLYIGMELSVVPIFQSEIVPAEVRGLTVATYQTSLVFGQLIMGLVCRGTSTLDSDAAWRIPFGLFFIVPSIVAACIWFVPESPRWYLLRGRAEESFESLKAFRQGSSYTEEQIVAEFDKLQLLLSEEEEKGKFSELFHGPNLRRTLITVGTNFFLQVTGQNFASTYGTLFIKSLGTVNPFTMQNIQTSVGLCIGLLAMWLTDSMGRRPLLFISGGLQVLSLFTMAGLGTPANVTYDMKSGIVAAFFLFGVGFSLGWAPISHILSSEIPASRLRDMTYRTASVVNICVQFAVTFSLPYLLYAPYAALGAKVGYIFGSTAVCAIIFTYFCVPECRYRTLEEVDRLFMDGVPIRNFSTAVIEVESMNKDDKELQGGKVEQMEQV